MVYPVRGIPSISFLTPYGFTSPLTRTHVRLLSPCFKMGRMGGPLADAMSAQVLRQAEKAPAAFHNLGDHVSTCMTITRAWVIAPNHFDSYLESIEGPAHCCSTSDQGTSSTPIHFPPDNCKHFLTFFQSPSYPNSSGG